MIKRGQSWWGWWEKKYFPLPEHGEASLTGFTTTFVGAGSTFYGRVAIRSFSTSLNARSGLSAKIKGPTLSLTASGTMDVFGVATLDGPTTTLSAVGYNGNYGAAELDEFTFSFSGQAGAVAELDGFTFTFTASAGAQAELSDFSSDVTANGYIGSNGRAYLGKFASSLESYAGSIAAVTKFSSTLTATGFSGAAAGASLPGFSTILTASADTSTFGTAYLRPPTMVSLWGKAALTGFKTQILAGDNLVVNPAIAYAINISSAETTMYTAYDFSHIVRLGNDYYGVKSDGLYLLEGADDNGTPISSKIKTSMMDFGTAKHKRVPYMYIDTEDATMITPYVEGEVTNSFTSAFNGRRTRLARGPSGRQWEFEVTNVLGGEMTIGSLEAYAQVLVRKV